MDNAGIAGVSNTLLSVRSSGFDLAVQGRARAAQASGGVLGSLFIGSNSWFTANPGSEVPFVLRVNNNAAIEAGGGIIFDGLGYAGGSGTGSGRTAGLLGGGGGYGGFGGASISNAALGGIAYGSASAPVSNGSGGGAGSGSQIYNLGGSGGGAFELTVSNALVMNGTISANGNPGVGQNSGGGAGGSVWITAGSISGSGLVSANGGAGDLPGGAGGGGGRIAVFYYTNQFAGSLTAYGGAGANYGGAGTVYLDRMGIQSPTTVITPYVWVIIDNGGSGGTNTPVPLLSGAYDLTVTGKARAAAGGQTIQLGTLLVASNSFLICTNVTPTILNVTNTATLEAGSGILLDGYGFAAGTGTGAGHTTQTNGVQAGSGGGYGGVGGSCGSAPGGMAYGGIYEPNAAGSGGGNGTSPYNPGGAGGGVLQFSVTSTLALDGTISANGGSASGVAGGGGSGGSIWVRTARLTGSGSISANGGAGGAPYGGGGGGGRIAIQFTAAGNTNAFAGVYSAYGGPGGAPGGAGTIYITPFGLQGGGQVIVDNGGSPSPTNTPLSALQSVDVTVSGGARAALGAVSSIRSLLVASNSWVTLGTNAGLPIGSLGLTITSNLIVQAGGVITMDGAGYGGGQGTGAGHTVSSAQGMSGSGAGHGGTGGSSLFGASGGVSYDDPLRPGVMGSGGGNTTENVGGGAGGGLLSITVNGTLALDGRLSADGLPASGPGSGGGSGGSVLLTVGQLTGSGIISASGGAGDPAYGGGGGGGRIAIYYGTNAFGGRFSAFGGPGAMAGGAGTIYVSPNKGANTPPQFIVNNGGQSGTNTPLSVTTKADLSILGGAVVTPVSLTFLNSLVIGSNSWLVCTNIYEPPLSVTASAIIQIGGGISLVGQGFPPGKGPGTGGTASNPTYGPADSGGGHGGFGGASITGAAGGAAYDSLLQPTNSGSGGGSQQFPASGAGGGALHLTVGTTLQVDGTIAADGGDALLEGGGGGAGGSLWLTVGDLSGAGVISANGGDGDYLQGGGGGGGRIAIYYATNAFQGPIRAWGGMGALFGGAGTIYSKANASAGGQVVVDNGGSAGTNTPLTTPEPFTLTVSGAAIVNPDSAPLVLGSLLVDSGGKLTHLTTQSNLDLTVFTNAVIGTNGAIVVDGAGYSGSNAGPGAGRMTNTFSGSGGGYGGVGGAGVSGIPGGGAYGSALQPTDRGSRGGIFTNLSGFCQGGGAVLLKVGGTLTLDGVVSANGNAGLIEGTGGGAGGSLWLTARGFEGSGMIFANGGPGEPNQGGGGGGGRIAVYCLSNSFKGTLGASGGPGASPGGAGTVYVTNSIPLPQVIAQSPSGAIESAVSYVDLTFGSLMIFSSATPADFGLDTPNGPLPSAGLAVSPSSLRTIRLSFPAQSALGDYEVSAGPQISDMYGQSMAAAYAGSFAIVPPTISGRVADANGEGVPYLTILVSGDAFPVLTDANGDYALEVYPSWAGTLTPQRGGDIFIPSSHTYTNVSHDLTNQNFLMATSEMMMLTSQRQGTNFNLSWFGLNGVSYRVLYSWDLSHWMPYTSPTIGTNGPMTFTMPIDLGTPAEYFRFSAAY